MSHRRPFAGLCLALVVLFAGCAGVRSQAVRVAAVEHPPVLAAFVERVGVARKNLPAVTTSAEAAAALTRQNPLMLINVPYGLQSSFAEEVLNRAGGLANALPPEERTGLVTDQDVLIMSARSWEDDAEKVRQMLKQFRKPGNHAVLFASKAGVPADIAEQVDVLIDNGADGPGRDEASVNALANVLNAWVWFAEYASALTRQGQHPGVLLSILMPGSSEHNGALQKNGETRRTLGKTDQAIAAGTLAKRYFERVDKLITDLAGETTQDSINRAAELVAAKLSEGGTVGATTCTHFLMSEIMFEPKVTGIKPFHCVWRAKEAFPANVGADDLIIWIGYVGVRTPNEDYAMPMRKTGAGMITTFVTDKKDAANNAPDALVHIEQHWGPPDAEVAVPFPPGVIAPVSGLDQGLIYRMLEDAVARRVASPAVDEPAALPVGAGR